MRWLVAAAAAMSLLIASGIADAVVQNVKLVDTSGKPVANQTVTIVFPPGVTDSKGNTNAKEETDEKGILWFDFPGDGKYRIEHAGGVLEWEVLTAGTPGLDISPLAVGAAIAAVGVGLYAANDDDDDGSPSDGDGSDDDDVAGTYSCSASQISNPDNHPIGSLNGTYTVTGSAGGSGTLQHASGSTSFTASGPISAEGELTMGTTAGTFEGRTGSRFDFAGRMNSGQLIVVCPACPDSNNNQNADPVQVGLSCSRSS
jgi:hypothetical protein